MADATIPILINFNEEYMDLIVGQNVARDSIILFTDNDEDQLNN
jgi:hypothetical protein